jgi:hypothetical protein
LAAIDETWFSGILAAVMLLLLVIVAWRIGAIFRVIRPSRSR